MSRIICDSFIKKDKKIFGEDPNTPFNQKILAVNNMYGWLYDLGILEKVSFEFKDYPEGTHFALDVKDLEPYRQQMEQCLFDGAALAVEHIFDTYYTPCAYSGAIQLGWMMDSYRSVDGSVGRSWECDLIKSLNVKGIYEVNDVLREKGPKAAVKALFAQFDWNPTLNEKKAALSDQIQDAEAKTGKQAEKGSHSEIDR